MLSLTYMHPETHFNLDFGKLKVHIKQILSVIYIWSEIDYYLAFDKCKIIERTSFVGLVESSKIICKAKDLLDLYMVSNRL